MSETSIVALVLGVLGFMQAVLVALIMRQNARVKRIEADARTAAEETRNDHAPINLREDMDAKHEQQLVEQRTAWAGVTAQLKEALGAIIGIRKDLRQLRDDDLEQRREQRSQREQITDLDKKFDQHVEWSQKQASRIDDIEDTIPVPKKE